MRATLFHNPTAGELEYSADALLGLLREYGIEAKYQSIKKEGWATAIEDPGDLVVVAGGDGSIAKVAKGLTERDIPLAILPIGTANNIATSLGIVGPPKQLVPCWDPDRTRPLDIGVAVGPWGKRRFVESVGLGAIATAIALANTASSWASRETRDDELEWARAILLAALSSSRALCCELEMDATSSTREYLILEAMSTSHLGPAIRLAPEADPGDSQLDVVVVEEARRGALEGYIAQVRHTDRRVPGLSGSRAREVSFQWDGQPLHIDDEVFSGLPDRVAGGRERVTLRLEESVRVLAGADA